MIIVKYYRYVYISNGSLWRVFHLCVVTDHNSNKLKAQDLIDFVIYFCSIATHSKPLMTAFSINIHLHAEVVA